MKPHSYTPLDVSNISIVKPRGPQTYTFRTASQINLTGANYTSANKLDKSRVNLRTWHRRYAHLSIPNVIWTAKAVDGMNIKGLPILKHVCEPCMLANATTRQGHEQMTPALHVGQHLFMDIGGRYQDLPDAHGSSTQYWIIFMDHYSHFIYIKFLKFKLQVKLAIMLLVEEFKKVGIEIMAFHSDQGGEFASKELTTWARKQAIKWEYTALYTHSQNAIIK